MSLVFKPEDFDNITCAIGQSDEVAIRANEIFKKWIDSKPIIASREAMTWDEISSASWEMKDWGNYQSKARLVGVEEIKKKECEQAARFDVLSQEHRCVHCNIRVKPAGGWVAADSIDKIDRESANE